jgi:diamine N-acetyltransferase
MTADPRLEADRPGVNIRTALPSDAASLAAFAQRTFRETFGAANTPENMRAYVRDAFSVERIGRELSDSRLLILVAEIDGTMAGYPHLADAELRATDRRAGVELVRMYVDSAYHGRGVAGALMERCIDAARAAGHTTMWLGVWEHNPRAQAFYAKWQFLRVGEHDFLLGEDRQTDWIMERDV